MCLDKFPWQVAERATVSETNPNSACQLLQSKTNKRFTDWDGWGEVKREERGIKAIKKGSQRGRYKKEENRENIWHLSSMLWRLTYSSGTAWQISHPSTTGMRPEWRKDLWGCQQTAWHINHPSPLGCKLYRETQVAERHGLAGSVHTERSAKTAWPVCRTGKA